MVVSKGRLWPTQRHLAAPASPAAHSCRIDAPWKVPVLLTHGRYLPTRRRTAKGIAAGALNERQALEEVIKEVVGFHVLLMSSFFADDILRR
jgi:hypothetical protein